jgi:exonuclease III
MKIVTWNCNGAFRNKFLEIARLDADVYIIQECENPKHSKDEYLKWAENFLWIGENKHKGLGVFAKPSIQLTELNWQTNGLQLFLPVNVNNLFNLVAVWTKYANSPTFRYIGQLWKYLELHKMKMSATQTVLCGDFNSNKIWDVWDRWWNHSDVVRELASINMVSLYHLVMREEQGTESIPTFFHQHNIKKPYHIDFVFCSRELFNLDSNVLTVGNHNEWLTFSDHVPIIFTIAV